MKVKIKSFNGELPDYLTLGKEYEVVSFLLDGGNCPRIVNDDGFKLILCLYSCDYLNGGSWEVVNE